MCIQLQMVLSSSIFVKLEQKVRLVHAFSVQMITPSQVVLRSSLIVKLVQKVLLRSIPLLQESMLPLPMLP